VNNWVNYFSFELGFLDMYIGHSPLDSREFQLIWLEITSFVILLQNYIARLLHSVLLQMLIFGGFEGFGLHFMTEYHIQHNVIHI
jgi:hypothetical protein